MSGVLPMPTAGMMNNWVIILLLILLPLFSHFPSATDAYRNSFPSANASVSWENSPSNEQGSVDFVDGSTLRPILLVYNITKSYPPFGLGFFTNKTSISSSVPTSVFYLVVFMVTGVSVSDNGTGGEYQFNPDMPPKVLWSANRDSPVGENATLDFTAEGDLVLRDELGTVVWSTNTSSNYVARMEIDVTGNLMLLNGSNGMVWQSYDHPTDTWLPNQKIYNGQRLTASNSSSNLSSGLYYLTVDIEDNIGIRAFVDSDPPEEYATLLGGNKRSVFGDPAFGNAYNAIQQASNFAVFYFNFTASPTDFRFIVLEPDGHLVLYFVDTSYPYSFVVTPRSGLLSAVRDSIKVQNVPSRRKLESVSLPTVLIPHLIGVLLVVTFIGGMYYWYRKRKHRNNVAEENDDQVTNSLTKFSFEELKSYTQNFQIKLGQGGFGAVFEGILHDGIKVAVKQLDSIVQGRKEFLAEVNTIGKVEHLHLVRLIGYCAEKSKRLLVYEHMFNGSLDKWIFDQDKGKTLDWKTRQRIIHGVAKGLQYLHEECHNNIIHFDIKPQNILLDGDFNAKISDFGLARLFDGKKSLVLTSLKGTVGYLAPEMFRGSHISPKADVYSFGVVILETICGRKNLNETPESVPLVELVQTKAREDQLHNLIDDQNEDIWHHKEEAIKMMKIGIWCLQTHDRRPCMSTIIKVLEGSEGIDLITVDSR